jgi:hypothetical protein
MQALNAHQFQMRASDEFLAKIDEWRRVQPDIPGRIEAIRRLVEIGMESDKKARRKREAKLGLAAA